MLTTAVASDAPAVFETRREPNAFPLAETGAAATVVYDSADADVVRIASDLFAEDVARVTQNRPTVRSSLPASADRMVLIGTVGRSRTVDGLIASGKLDAAEITGGWERYLIQVVENPFPNITRALVIAGSDRRGTAFGVFSLSEAIGVSPWYWWADVPAQSKSELFVSATRFVSKTPSVRYRGIFLNDEDWGLQEWAERNFEGGPDEVKDIGPKTYAKIFELLLRLKANFVWPAMHPSTAAFNAYPSNKVVADQYAIVMGSSHAEPMLRNNVYEWSRFVDPVTGQSFSEKEFDYQRNQPGVFRYWEQRAMSNGIYENVYTLGKRGIHDSGMVEGSNRSEKAAWLNRIFTDQRSILAQHVNPALTNVPQVFVPYKEVLAIYDTGLLNVPDDVTLVWPDDNHGYIRRLSDAAEQRRSGGGGVYYHISYWGAPADYLWLCSTPPALIWEEMMKAFAYNCDRIWVVNVGDIKPGEIGTEFFLRLAWDVTRFNEDAQSQWLKQWAAREFGSGFADRIAGLLNDFYQLGFERKPEHMNWRDTDPGSPGPYPLFSHVHHGDESSRRLAAYSDLVQRAQALNAALPANARSSFFQTVLYPILGADAMNRKFLNAGRAHLAFVQGRNSISTHRAASQQGYDDIQKQTAVYNSGIESGKWNHMMSSKPRALPVFNESALPPAPKLGAGILGVVLEGRAQPVFLSRTGIVFHALPGCVQLDVKDAAVIAPLAKTDIAGKLAVWMPNNGSNYAPGAGGSAAFKFNLPVSGSYALSFEVNAANVNDDSWFVQIDNGPTNAWNNLQNSGVWTWTEFDSVDLSAGAHTITIFGREDGAALAGIKLISSSTVLVEDQSEGAFQLPEFNRFTQRSFFIDLFNTGTNALDWQIAPGDSWVKVSQGSGTLESETRFWVSIDWPRAPLNAALTSHLTLSHAGKTVTIPIRVWNPPMQLPPSVNFVEDNRATVMEAENFSRRRDGSDAAWTPLPGLGSGGSVMMVSPVTASSRVDLSEITNTSPSLEYNVYLRTPGTISVTAQLIPTLPINRSRGLRFAVAFDNEAPQIVDASRDSGSGAIWSRSVLRSRIDYTTIHSIAAAGPHTLKIWMVDPGVVLDRIVAASGSLPYTYGGPPETAVTNR